MTSIGGSSTRKAAKKERSRWLQEAASEYLMKRTKAEEVEAYFAGYERTPLSDDELALLRWNAEHFSEALDEPALRPKQRCPRPT